MSEDLRSRAAAVGVSAHRADSGPDGDALATLLPEAWWATIREPADLAGEHGPYPSEDAALTAGLALVAELPG